MTYESLAKHSVDEVIRDQHKMIKGLKARFSRNTLSSQEEQFFRFISQRDYAELAYQLK